MSELTTYITSVRLARDRVRLFAAPILFVLIAAAAVAGGLLVGGPGGISLVAVGALAALVAAYVVALVSSYRLLVEPGVLRLQWLGGERRYRLVQGKVTRVGISGENAGALRPRFGALGWAVGPAVLRGEPIELISLSKRPPLIVAPTDRGRLAIAAAVESELLEAMTHAVRLQERLDEVASRRAAPPPPEVVARPPAPAVPRVLTGIERTLIEQRLAAERAAALAAAEVEQAGAAATVVPEAADVPDAVSAPATPAAPRGVEAPSAQRRVARPRRRAQWQRPAWVAVPGPATVAAALPIALPLIGAGIAWIAVTVTGLPALQTDEARILLTALVLIGPLGALGGFLALAWYPRLGGLVMVSSVAALVMLTRTILA
ncbi:MAG: hypothetical protein H0W81_11170 [Chloroflexi bacterium]|nr:hypothetical protein [Chloroflexota bacterium]